MNQHEHAPPARNLATYARYGLAAVAFLFAAGVVLQVFLVGLSLFESGAHWEDHRTFGNMIGLLTWLLPPLALLGRSGRRLVGLALGVWVLFHLQYPFAQADTGWVGALHAVNALVLIWLSPRLGRAAFALARTRAQPGSAPAGMRLDPAESAGAD